MSSADRPSLKQRALKAGIWTVGGYAFGVLLRFGSNLLMTRLLVPDAFGVMAIANIVMAGLALFSDIGLKPNIVQSARGKDPLFLNTAWVLQLMRGAALWVVALGISVAVAKADQLGLFPKDSVYNDPRLPAVIAISAFTAVLGGIQSTKLIEASRNLSLARMTLIEIGSQVSGLICMLTWVYFDRSVWALVSGGITSALVKALLSHACLPGTSNRWQWDRAAFSEIFHFGKWIFLASVLGFFVNNGDRLMLGSMIDSTLLGIYVIAFLIFSTVDQLAGTVINDVSFPALSEVARERRADLNRTYYRFRFLLGMPINFCAGGLMISGHALINLLYDPRYAEAGWMLEVLAIGLLMAPFRISIYSFMALGAARPMSHISSVRCVALFTLMFLGFKFAGVQGALWGIVISYISILPIVIFHQIKFGLFDLRKELLTLPSIALGMLAGYAFNLVTGL